MTKRVLVADDEPIIRKVLKGELTRAGYAVETAVDGAQALSLCRSEPFSAVILDVQMPRQTGMQVLRQMQSRKDTAIILITAHASITSAVEAMKLGADDYLTKPFDNQELLEKLAQAIAIKQKARTYAPTAPAKGASRLLGSSDAALELQQKIQKIRDLDTTILITGESGTGKSIVAKEIHYTGARKARTFVHLDCAGLPANLIESELFGHEKGAFTSAVEQRKGKFELAGDGTLFLDEIGCLPLVLQSKLLNVLQERQAFRVGGTKAFPIQARILAATNENLEGAVQAGTFRQDLYYRLDVIRLECPPLRYRKGDIRPMAEHFIRRHSEKMGKQIRTIDPDFWSCIARYSWPGNVRELENILEGTIALSEGEVLTADDLPLRVQGKRYADEGAAPPQETPTGESNFSLKDREVQTILMALKKHNGHRLNTAQELGISRRTLQYKLKKMESAGILF